MLTYHVGIFGTSQEQSFIIIIITSPILAVLITWEYPGILRQRHLKCHIKSAMTYTYKPY